MRALSYKYPKSISLQPNHYSCKEKVTKAMRATVASSLLAETSAAPLGLSSGLSVACVTPHHCAQDLKIWAMLTA